MKISPLIITAFLFSFLNLAAQDTGKLRGFVTDSDNGEALAYGNVYIEELRTGASTDANGYYLITSIPSGKTYTVSISYVGYESRTYDVFIAPNKITELNVQLVASGIELQAVEKVEERIPEKNATDIGLQRISIRDLETLPKGVETDVFRSLQYIPGVKTTGDVSARYYVRGGSSDQNLVLLDGATIYNPFHALGLFSVFDPEVINNIEFYKGGYTAEYGERLSSVLQTITRDGNKNYYGGRASISLLTVKALAEGPIPSGSFILSGRKSYNNQVLKKFFNDQDVPFNFYDIFFKLNTSPNFFKNTKFEFFTFLSDDKLDNNDPYKEDFSWVNNSIGFKWSQIYESPLLTEFGIYYSKFKGEVIPNFSNSLPRRNEVNDVTLKFDFTYAYENRDELTVGLYLKTLDTKLYQENSNGTISDISDFSSNISLYAKYKFLRYENFGLDLGTRANLAGLTRGGSFFFEPRVSMTFRPVPFLALKAAWGIYLQEVNTISDENEVIALFEPWVITPSYLDPAKAIHYTGGMKLNFNPYTTVDLEAYYKRILDLPSINYDKKFDEDPDLVSGSGESYGLEILFKYRLYPFSFTTAYTLSYAYKTVENWVYYPKYDSRHSLNIALEYSFWDGWSASAVWSFSTGLPFTELIAFYDRLNLGNLFHQGYYYDSFSPYSILADRNLGRLPNYHRLDLNLSKKFEISSVKFTIDLSIINVYDRENIFYFDRETYERVNQLPFLPSATLRVEI